MFCFDIISIENDSQDNSLNAKLFKLQPKLKSASKNFTEVTWKLSSNMVGDSNDENDFLLKI